MGGWAWVGGWWVFVCVCIRSLLHSVHFGQQLHCARERIVNRIKVYIEGNNMQVELIRFLKKISPLLLRSGEFNATRVFTLR